MLIDRRTMHEGVGCPAPLIGAAAVSTFLRLETNTGISNFNPPRFFFSGIRELKIAERFRYPPAICQEQLLAVCILSLTFSYTLAADRSELLNSKIFFVSPELF